MRCTMRPAMVAVLPWQKCIPSVTTSAATFRHAMLSITIVGLRIGLSEKAPGSLACL
jgi:hypothetical protein